MSRGGVTRARVRSARVSGSASFDYQESGTESYQSGSSTTTYTFSTSVQVTVRNAMWARIGDPSRSEPISYELQSGALSVSGHSDTTALGVNDPGCEVQTVGTVSPRTPAAGENQRFDYMDVSGGGTAALEIVARVVSTTTQTFSSACLYDRSYTDTTNGSYDLGVASFPYTIAAGPSFAGTLTRPISCQPPTGFELTGCDITDTYTLTVRPADDRHGVLGVQDRRRGCGGWRDPVRYGPDHAHDRRQRRRRVQPRREDLL
jgi:hypothetical protein